MGSYQGAEIGELVETYIFSLLSKFTDKNNCGLYRNDGPILLKNTNRQQMNKIRKLVMKSFKDVGFKIKFKFFKKILDFLNVTLNLNKGKYSSYKKTNDKILYINTLSNHPLQIIKHLPTSLL